MANLGPETWDEFLESLEEWWLDCTEFVNCRGRRMVSKRFRCCCIDIATWCYDHTSVNPTKLTDLTLYVETQQDRPLPRFDFPAVPIERIERQLERCVFDVAYLRELAVRELGVKNVSEVLDKNAARDEWMYNQRKANKSLELIQMDLEDHPEWNYIKTTQGVGSAIDRYCDRNDLPRLRLSETR